MPTAQYPLTHLAERLFETGEVEVQRSLGDLDPADLAAFDAVLAVFCQEDRRRLPGRAPNLDPAAGRWAGERFYRACQCLQRRDISAEQVREYLQPEWPGDMTPEVVYSADLLFRYLGDMVRLARGLAPGDELVVCLRGLAAAWPFSSVGMRHLPPLAAVQPIADDDALRLAYVDRIIAARDKSRLEPIWVREGVRQAIGLHPELWPDFDPGAG